MKDQKAALGNGSKPPLSHVRGPLKNYIARGCDYGCAKYVRANFLLPSEVPGIKGSFLRLGAYMESVDRHLTALADSMESHIAIDPELQDETGMRAAAYAPDDSPGNDRVGPSYLPHLAHLAAAVNMAITQAVKDGLLPDDPGQPWVKQREAATDPRPNPACETLHGPTVSATQAPVPVDLVHVVAAGLEPKTAPYNPAPRCEHDIMIGRHCVDCPNGKSGDKAAPVDKCTHDRAIGLACKECGGWARREVREG